jgi:hypothetical protein
MDTSDYPPLRAAAAREGVAAGEHRAARVFTVVAAPGDRRTSVDVDGTPV